MAVAKNKQTKKEKLKLKNSVTRTIYHLHLFYMIMNYFFLTVVLPFDGNLTVACSVSIRTLCLCLLAHCPSAASLWVCQPCAHPSAPSADMSICTQTKGNSGTQPWCAQPALSSTQLHVLVQHIRDEAASIQLPNLLQRK